MPKDRSLAPSGDDYNEQWKALGAWFLGPRAENHDVFLDTFKAMFERTVQMRKDYFPSDPAYITEAIKSSNAYRNEVENMKNELLNMHKEMEGSVPFFSPRYQGHMNWDVTMPAALGYMGAMLFNQNNVDSAASPVTTMYEKRVGLQLCQMLGFNVDEDKKEPVAWGHITCGGSIANIEALWASRNIKFVPLAVREALKTWDKITQDQRTAGLGTTVIVYRDEHCKRRKTALRDCTNWQLLNIDIDEICELVERVTDNLGLDDVDGPSPAEFSALVETCGVMSMGLYDFMKKHNIEHSPRYTAPANNHYSWPKAGTVLGLGSNALIPIQLDNNFRQKVYGKDGLQEVLQNCLDNRIPVIAVVAIMGSTEESAVDPIVEINKVRKHFKKNGLDFALLADGAWGGYFKTMLIGKDRERAGDYEGFVPFCDLSDYVKDQYLKVKVADTITIDPHKSGFCPYPGGGLCYRNGKMRYPIALYHPEVFHGDNDPTMGVYGLEGSKPGAGPTGILMSHNVIGLDKSGYGRILGQCTTTTKLFYSLWLTVARDDDPFICVPIQEVPEKWKDTAKDLINNKIAMKTMKDIFVDGDDDAKEFLRQCGPDTMINSFVVNFKDNKDVEKANKLQVALADAMNIYVGTNPHRIPLLIMQSGLDAEKHGEGLSNFKRRIGLCHDDGTNLNVMCNCCMNPWQWNISIWQIGGLFRNIVLNCIGRINDLPDDHHRFIMSGPPVESDHDSLFIEYLTETNDDNKKYQISAKLRPLEKHRNLFRDYIKKCNAKKLSVELEIVNPKHEEDELPNLYNILHLKKWNEKIFMTLKNDDGDPPSIAFKMLDIIRYQRLDESSAVCYPDNQTYFIYGDSKRTIMSHVITKLPDFQHTVALTGRPHSLTENLLEKGVMVEVLQVDGYPNVFESKIINPLQRDSEIYDICFKGELHSTIHSTAIIDHQVIPARGLGTQGNVDPDSLLRFTVKDVSRLGAERKHDRVRLSG